MRKLVFDIETKNAFFEVGTQNAADLDISVVGLYDYFLDQYLAFEEHEFPKMWSHFEQADMLITYNGNHFDIPLLNKYYAGDLTRIYSLDILKELHKSAGRRMKLDQVAEGTLGTHKTGDGLEALEWWRNGEKQKVKDYCLMDVKLTKEIFEYARMHNKLYFSQGGQRTEVPLAAHNWEDLNDASQALTYSLPF